MYSIADVVVSDISCDLFLIILVDENEGVVLWISGIVLNPIVSRVIRLFVLAVCNCDVRRGGYTLEECRWGSNLSNGILEIWFDFVRECGYVGKVGDAIVFAVGDRQGVVDFCITHGGDRDHEISCACFHELRELGVSLSVAENGFAQSDGALDLIWWWGGGLDDLGMNHLRICWGGREAGEVRVILGGSRGWGG